MFPFVLPWDDATYSFTNLNSISHKPAGLFGFVTAKGGHLFSGDDRIRFVGMNFSFSANLPASKSDAEVIAARLAKYGINCVRMTLLDKDPAPNGILMADMRTLDTVSMDRLDYFVSQLKKNGVYILLPLHVGRDYPGIESPPDAPPHHSGVDNYLDAAIALQKEYAMALLSHINPYTGAKYADEPAIALVEINNENALTQRWWEGDLDRLSKVFREPLEEKWNTWLASRYESSDALRGAWLTEYVGANMLLNGDFVQGLEDWQLLQAHGSRASVEIALDDPEKTNVAKIKILETGRKDYGVQFYQRKLSLSQNTSYTLEFDARADTSREIAAALVQPEPFKILYMQKNISISTQWKRFSLVFTPTESSINAWLSFTKLANRPGTIKFANVSLKRGGAVGLANSESLGHVNVVKRSEFTQRTRRLQVDWLQFLAETEERYWTEMYRFLKNDLKIKSPIIGTQQNYSPYFVQQKMDVIDMHGYWDKQLKLGDNMFEMDNKSQIGDQNAGAIGMIAARRIQGKPFIVSEYNYRGANTYSSEADLLMLAYASLQDWDGLFIFNYANNNKFGVDRMTGDEGFNGHSNRLVQLVPAALMFRRGDIKASGHAITVTVTRDMLLNKMRSAGPAPGTYDFSVDIKQPLKTGVSIKVVEPPGNLFPRMRTYINNNNAIISDTGELTWDPGAGDGKGIFTINAVRTKALIGFVREQPYDLGGIIIRPGKTIQNWAAITLTAMSPANSRLENFLLTATGNSENTEMVFSADRTRYTWGKSPVLVEGIQAEIILPAAAASTRAWALDETGEPKAVIPVADYEGKALIEINSRYQTLWYKIEISNPN